jgi:prepilin-type N-terminal cleavage/methylation domain-containing protein
LIGHFDSGELRLGTRFWALSKLEQVAVAEHVGEEFDKIVFQHPTDYVSKNAQADPQGWQDRLCELIASDPRRLQEIVDSAQQKTRVIARAGFTLFEMVIVLIIIGLIAGVAMVGQDLVKAAQIQKAVTELRELNAAVNTFLDKYSCIPGDCANATTYFGATYISGWGCTGNGDGNKYIDKFPCENLQAFQGLKAAELMSYFDTQYGAHNSNNTTNSIFFPGPNDSNGWLSYEDPYGAGQRYGTTVVWSTYSGGCINGYALSPTQAWQIDQKIDDGLPNTGNFLGIDAATPTSSCTVVPASCVTAGVNSYVSSSVLGCRTVYFFP